MSLPEFPAITQQPPGLIRAALQHYDTFDLIRG